jgi:general secretion pathway protein D
MRTRHKGSLASAVLILSLPGFGLAQTRTANGAKSANPAAARLAATQAADPLVTLNFPQNAPLSALINYISERLEINFIFDDAIARTQFSLRTPVPVRQSQLLEVLRSVLQTKNLILEETNVPGFKRIILAQSAQMTPAVQTGAAQAGVAAAPGNQMVTRFYALQYARPDQVLPLVQSMLSKPIGRAAVLQDKQAIVLTDYATNIQRVVEFLQVADSWPDHQALMTIPVRHNDVKQLTQTLQSFIQAERAAKGEGPVSVTVTGDELSSQIIVSGATDSVKRIAELVDKLDLAREVRQTTCFYKLTNTVAEDILSTLRALDSETGQAAPTPGSRAGKGGNAAPGAVPAFGQPLPAPKPGGNNEVRTPGPGDFGTEPGRSTAQSNGASSRPVIAADENTNSIIIIGSEGQQQMYEQIIKKLDQRRPQVMIETTVVSLDTSDGFTLGVDVATGHDAGKVISFGSFGVSKVDPTKGTLTPQDATGGTLALLSPEVASVVIHALSSSSHSRLVSMPRVLVNDNSTGKLASVQDEPFQRTVITNDSTIVGEGNNAEAGTTINVTPHISSGDYLQLEYDVELSSFNGQAATNLPPPSLKNTVSSKVTIPDGDTIVVGGLNQSNDTETVSAIPFLGQVPVLKYLFSSRNQNHSNTTLFIFIRPSILRDDQFRDLKYISAVDRKVAKLPDDLPSSEPMVIQPR